MGCLKNICWFSLDKEQWGTATNKELCDTDKTKAYIQAKTIGKISRMEILCCLIVTNITKRNSIVVTKGSCVGKDILHILQNLHIGEHKFKEVFIRTTTQNCVVRGHKRSVMHGKQQHTGDWTFGENLLSSVACSFKAEYSCPLFVRDT